MRFACGKIAAKTYEISKGLMANSVLETIIEKVKSLTAEERQRLLESLEQEQHAERVRSVRGKYAHLGVSTEEVLRSKAEEIELEERRGES
jgi:CHASE1-domain containing sensor protein